MQVKALVQELWHRHSSDDLLYAVRAFLWFV